jgi:FdhD protein
MKTSEAHPRTLWRESSALAGTRLLAEETAVAISYNGSTHVVLMASPSDLEDLAVGFSVTEGIVDDLAAIESIAIEEFPQGLDVQVRVREDIADRLAKRRRNMAGPVGCGLCGLESLEAAVRSVPPVTAAARFSHADILSAARALEAQQVLNKATSSVHAAGFFRPATALGLVREDVGRHNALDKLIGALLRAGQVCAEGGIIVTSRVSVELVQKTALAGAGLLAAISAPTALAVRTAAGSGLTLAAVVRGRSFECFTHPDRIKPDPCAHVA